MRVYPVTIGFMILLASCGTEADSDTRPVVTVSILPQQYFVERLAGDLVEVNVMVPPGASPATYEPTVSQLKRLSRSAIYFRIGYIGFETGWFDRITASNPGMRIVDLSAGIETIHEEAGPEIPSHEHDHGGTDPHIWMSVQNVKVIAGHLHREFLEQFPRESELLDRRYDQWLTELDSLYGAIGTSLEKIETRSFMIYHPALTYFAKDYGLRQYPLELEGKSPSPSQMKRMVDLGIEENISILFIQKQFDQHNARILASEIEAQIVQIDPLDPDWKGQMIYIANQLKMQQ